MGPAGLAFVLHAHLPFVRHPEREDALEERWLFQAITETHIPLLEMLDVLDRDRVRTRLVISISPPLLGMLADRLLRTRYVRHLDRLVELAEQEERRTRPDGRLHRLAEMHLGRFYRARTFFLDEWQQDIAGAFRAYQDRGLVELATTGATHGVLPLLAPSPAAVRAQVEVAVAEHERFFGRPPAGFWLPECAWEPGLDVDLARAGVRYFVVDTHGIAHATPRPLYGVFAPVACESGVAAFGRDPECVRQLCGGEDGYCADPWYRDFERDVGLDLPADYVAPYVAADGRRCHTGIKYHRVTGPGVAPELYDPERARERARAHAEDFVAARLRQVEWLGRSMDRPPVVVCAFDAALLGHRWFEGPFWLELVLRRLAATPALAATTPADELDRHPVVQRATPGASSWGRKGYFETWIGGDNDWTYRHLHAAGSRLHALCARYPSADERTRRALTQALRELFLAQAGDWPLLMANETHAAYATRRTREHLQRCGELCTQVERGAVDDLRLGALEDADNLFPALDYRVLL
jgi:1,4-alpha-glucan branching enzyme